MTISDPISDMLTRLRNALAVGKTEVLVPYSKEKLTIAKVLVEQGFIESVSLYTPKDSKFEVISVTLKYSNKAPVIRGIRRISKPGQRIYQPAKSIKQVLGGVGTAVVSTSKGVITDTEARAQGVGGEVLFKIW